MGLLASITRALTDTVFVTDLDLRILRSVTTVDTLLGYAPSEFIGRRPSERFEAEFLDDDEAEQFTRLQNHQAIRVRLRLTHKDRTRLEADATVTPILDAVGAPCGFVNILRDVTARRDAERALRLSEDRFRSVFEQSRDAIALVRSDRRVLAVNAAALVLFGRTEAELRSMDHRSLVVGDAWSSAVDQRRETGMVVSEMTFVRGDGTTFLGEYSSSAFGTDGEHTLYATTVRDISEARRLTEAVRTSEGHLRAVLSTMAEGVVVQDMQGHIVTCNAAAERILGLTRQQIEGRTSLDPRWRAVHEDERPFPGDEHPALVTLRTGEPQSGVVMGVHLPDDSLRWILISTEPLQIEGTAERLGVVATFTDITERQRMMRALETLRSRLAFAFDGAEDGVWDWNVETGHVEFSPRWAAMIGYTVEEIEPHVGAWERLVHPDDLSRLRPTLEAHLAGDTPQYESEFRMRHKDGRWLWILDRGKVVARDTDGRPLRAVGTHVDITARREAEEALREALAANERLVAELREAAHKIKTLTGFIPICMFCKKIRDDQGYWERLEAYISAHSDAKFSHGLCPECRKEHYGDL
jgi:PAS domain S-box-containing protein